MGERDFSGFGLGDDDALLLDKVLRFASPVPETQSHSGIPIQNLYVVLMHQFDECETPLVLLRFPGGASQLPP